MSHFPKEFEGPLLSYLSLISPRNKISGLEQLEQMDTREFLQLLQKTDDQVLGLVILYLKSSARGREFFEKLMGEHEEENRQLVDSFFDRYMKLVIPDEEDLKYANPLITYLPAEVLDDLAFVESRRSFFLRQTIDTINEYFFEVLKEDTDFKAGEQEQAWLHFWESVSKPQ